MMAMAACMPVILAVLGPVGARRHSAEAACRRRNRQGLVVFTGPLLFALAKASSARSCSGARLSLSVAAVSAAGLVFGGISVEEQLTGLAGVRALLFLLVFVPSTWRS